MEDEDIAPTMYTELIQLVGMCRKSCLCTLLQYSVLARLSDQTNWISCRYLAHYSRLPFCVLFYIQLILLWHIALFYLDKGIRLIS